MDTPPLKLGTSATVQLVPQLGIDGSVQMVLVIKERFAIDAANQVERVGGATITAADEPWEADAPETSSTKFPSDICLRKPGTDVIAVGAAMAMDRKRVRELDVMVRIGEQARFLRVFGPRVWFKAAGGGLGLSSAEPFEDVQLRWELAWGGSDMSDPARPLEEARNPVGRGVTHDLASLVHRPGPQIEDPRSPIDGARGRPVPAGVASLGRNFEPRRGYAGTMDEAWRKERMPLVPADFDDRFNQVAVPELVTAQHLRGGERLSVHNMSAEGPIHIDLPRLHFYAGVRTDRGWAELRPVLDTVLVQPNERLLDMVWRAAFTMPKVTARVRLVQVHEKDVI